MTTSSGATYVTDEVVDELGKKHIDLRTSPNTENHKKDMVIKHEKSIIDVSGDRHGRVVVYDIDRTDRS